MPWEEILAEAAESQNHTESLERTSATVLCRAACELAKPSPSPEDAPLWDFIDLLFFFLLLSLAPLFKVQLRAPERMS